MANQISSNMEDYLEAIYVLEQENGYVRVKDVASSLNVTMPSVSGAIKKMEKNGWVSHPRYDLIALTLEGIQLAEEIYNRHLVIKQFLQDVLGLDSQIAEEDACKIEHIISDETLAGFERFIHEQKGSDHAC